MPCRMMSIARAELADILRAPRFGARRNRERNSRSTVEPASIWVAKGAVRCWIGHGEEVDEVVGRCDELEALDGAGLHRQQDGYTNQASPGRSEPPTPSLDLGRMFWL